MAVRQTGRSCKTRSLLDSVEIPKPLHRFSGSTMSSNLSVMPLTSTKTGNTRRQPPPDRKWLCLALEFRRYLVSNARFNYFQFGGPSVSVSGVGRCRDIVDLCCQFHINVVQFTHFTGTLKSVFMFPFLSW
jgi:hypothetical protein